MNWQTPRGSFPHTARRCSALLRAASCLALAASFSAGHSQAAPIPPQANPIDLDALQQGGRLTRDLTTLSTSSASRRRSAVATGDTYGLAATGFDGEGTNGKYVSDAGGVVLTFSGDTFHEIAPSFYGNEGDSMYVFENTYQLDDQRVEVVIEVLAFDADFNLTNWYADGSEAAPGVPFESASVNIGDFNAPLDKLDVGTGSSEYVLESAEYWFVGSEGGYFGPGGEAFEWFDTSSGEGISGSSYTDLGADVSTATFGEQEFTGFSMSFVLAPAAVPEPASALLLTPLAMLGGVRRR